MKLISEEEIRAVIDATHPKIYYIPPGRILSPAARDFLNRELVKIDVEKNREVNEAREAREAKLLAERALKEKPAEKEEPAAPADAASAAVAETPAALEVKEPMSSPKPRYVDFETGAIYETKPESMTQLFGNKLVFKNDDRIRFRGKLDLLQAEVIRIQCMVMQESKSEALIHDLGDILAAAREIMRADVLNDPLKSDMIIGLNHDELRDQSHHPQKYFEIKNQQLPDYTMGLEYALLNGLRASIREAEVIAVDAFMVKRKIERTDIVEELNRLSSAVHIMMMRYQTGAYA